MGELLVSGTVTIGFQEKKTGYINSNTLFLRVYITLSIYNPIVGMGCLDHQTYSIGKGMDPIGNHWFPRKED